LRTPKSRRRAPKEIAYAIIKSTYDGERKTKIMYQAGLNLSQLNTYMSSLLEQGMIMLGERRMYSATEKGKKFLKAYERYSETKDLLVQQERVLEDLWSIRVKSARSESPELHA
jgi:predicted transcriptional regulator